MEWSPIETAPKDTRILVAAGSIVTVAEWIDDEWYSGEYAGPFEEGLDPQPTHWAPLPEPPAESPVIETAVSSSEWLSPLSDKKLTPREERYFGGLGRERGWQSA